MNRSKKKSMRIIPLGGCGEFGRNSTAFLYQDEMVVVDFGVKFYSGGDYGINLILPDISFVYQYHEKIKALVLTHGHEDHIGAIPWFLSMVNVPVYGTQFTLKLVMNRLKEFKMDEECDFRILNFGVQTKVSNYFSMELLETTHSIVDSAAVLLETPLGKILHSGDYKIDNTPISGNGFDLQRVAELGKEGVLLFLSDSTNVLRSGFSGSELSLVSKFRKIIRDAEETVFFTTFASHIQRIQIILNLAEEFGKKVFICGRSLENNIKLSSREGYLILPEEFEKCLDDLQSVPRNNRIVIVTGSQGEKVSVLSLLGAGKHQKLSLSKGDTVVLSSRVIPGNEMEVSKMINNILAQGVVLIDDQVEQVHVSGHGCREELKLMLNLLKPKFFLPLHGDYRNLLSHQELAGEIIGLENTQLMLNGDWIEITEDSIRKVQRQKLEDIYIDSANRSEVPHEVFYDRQTLSEFGIVIVVLVVKKEDRKENESGSIFAELSIEFISRGFVYMKDSMGLFNRGEELIRQVFQEELSEKNKIDMLKIKQRVKIQLQRFFFKNTRKRPLIIVRFWD